MGLEELKNNKIINDAVELIIADKTFLNKCETNFNKIFEDGKIDGDDIPLIISLVLMIYKNHTKIKINKNNLKNVFILLIFTLIDKFKGESPIDTDMIMMLLEPQIDLLFMSVNLPKMNCGFCGSKPAENEDNEINKLKINKIDKLKIKKVEVPKKIDETEKVDKSKKVVESKKEDVVSPQESVEKEILLPSIELVKKTDLEV